jgi:hypothetical protein
LERVHIWQLGFTFELFFKKIYQRAKQSNTRNIINGFDGDLNPTLKKVLPIVAQTLLTPKIPLKTNLNNLPKKPTK